MITGTPKAGSEEMATARWPSWAARASGAQRAHLRGEWGEGGKGQYHGSSDKFYNV